MKNQEENEEELSKNLKLIAKSSFFVFIGIALSKVFTYLYKIIIARNFGVEAFGLFSLALAIIIFFNSVGTFGFSEGIIRYVSLYRAKNQLKKARYLFRFSLKTLLVSSIVIFILIFCFSEYISINIFHNEKLIPFIRIFSIALPFSIISSIFLSVLKAYEKIENYSFIYNVLPNVIRVIMIFVFVLLGFSILSVPLSHIFGVTVMFFAAVFACKKYASSIFEKKISLLDREKNKMRRGFVKYSLFIFLSGMVLIVFSSIDSIFLGYFKSATYVGYYNVAFSVSVLLSVAPELFLQLFFPLISKKYAKKEVGNIKELSKQVGKWIFLINAPIFLILMIYPGVIINLIFGKEYLVAEQATRILAVGAMVLSIANISNNIVSMTGKSKLIFYNALLASILNVVLNALLIPKYGVIGASIATSTSLIILSCLFFWQAYAQLRILPLRRRMINIIFALVIPFLVVFLFRQHFKEINLMLLLISAGLFVVFYTAFLFIFRALDKNDVIVFRAAKKRFLTFNKKI